MRMSSEPTQSYALGDVVISADEGLIVLKHAAKEERLILGRIDGKLLGEIFTQLAKEGNIEKAAEALTQCSARARVTELTARTYDDDIEAEGPSGLYHGRQRRARNPKTPVLHAVESAVSP